MNRNQIIKIFQSFGFECENITKVGEVLKMSPEDAYLLSAITGAKYRVFCYM